MFDLSYNGVSKMQISYVISTMIFWWRENKLSFEQECQFIKSMGFGIELWPNIRGMEECRYDRHNWKRLLDATDGMLVSMRSRNDEPNIKKWAEQIECAKLLNANIVTSLKSIGISNDGIEQNLDFTREIVKLAEEHNVTLCIETGELSKVRNIGEQFDSVRYCLDVGYANLDPISSFKDYVDQLADRVVHLHLTDNYGQTDDHEPPGLKGGIERKNWDYLLDALYKCENHVIGSLEMCPCMPSIMVRQACQFLFDEMKWPNPPQLIPKAGEIIYNPV